MGTNSKIDRVMTKNIKEDIIVIMTESTTREMFMENVHDRLFCPVSIIRYSSNILKVKIYDVIYKVIRVTPTRFAVATIRMIE